MVNLLTPAMAGCLPYHPKLASPPSPSLNREVILLPILSYAAGHKTSPKSLSILIRSAKVAKTPPCIFSTVLTNIACFALWSNV